jgi:hypothetical protein
MCAPEATVTSGYVHDIREPNGTFDPSPGTQQPIICSTAKLVAQIMPGGYGPPWWSCLSLQWFVHGQARRSAMSVLSAIVVA